MKARAFSHMIKAEPKDMMPPVSGRTPVKGSLTVEAALVFPLFILVWVPFLYWMKYCAVYETLRHTVQQTAHVIAETGYLFELTGLKAVQDASWEGLEFRDPEEGIDTDQVVELVSGYLGDSSQVIAGALEYCVRVLESGQSAGKILTKELWRGAVDEVGKLICSLVSRRVTPPEVWDFWDVGAPRFTYSEFYYSYGEVNDWILLVAYVPVRWADPFGIFTGKNLTVSVQTRALTGVRGVGEMRPGEESGQEESSSDSTVYYRIGNGRKYHSLDCYLIMKDVSPISLSKAKSEGYKACDRCRAAGNTVYVTSRGEHYHSGTCPSLFPDVHALSEEELAGGRYSPCALCQTDGGWFS